MAGKIRIFQCSSHAEAYQLAQLMNRQVIVGIEDKVYRVMPTGVEVDITSTYQKFFGGTNAWKKASDVEKVKS